MKMHRIKHLKLHAGQGNDSMQPHIDLVLQLSCGALSWAFDVN